MIAYTHDTFLVLASIAVSLVAAFTGLALTSNIADQPDYKRKALVVMSAFILGGGIWSMHFVAMLAHKFPIPIYYDLLQTLGSVLIAILVVGLALLILHFTARTPLVLTLAGLLLGAGIVVMHYIGMLAIRGCIPVFSNSSIIISLLVAAVAGVAAIRVAYGRRSKQNIVAGSVVFGFAVVVVHHTAMFGTQFLPDAAYQPVKVSLANSTLAIAVTVAAFVICGTFLLATTTFLTSNKIASSDAAQPGSKASPSETSSASATPTPEVTNAGSPASPTPSKADHSANGSTPPASSIVPVTTTTLGTDGASTEQQTVAKPASDSLQIPYEQDKKIRYAASADVGAIRADGHYTHLYTQAGVHFCPWSITEADKRLAGHNFHRTHRSYLVNIAAINSFEKRKESGVCLFKNYPQLSSVPVSRNRVLALIDVLNTSGTVTS